MNNHDLREIIGQNRARLQSKKLPLVLGFDQTNNVHLSDLVELRHILMGGSTGSGKSTFQHTTITTLLDLLPPDQIRLFLADMKSVDLTKYRRLPNLFTEVETNPDSVFASLELLIKEKNMRLKSGKKQYSYIVAIIDTFSDLMMYNSSKFEDLLDRLMANATEAKIHVIMSDSRMSTEVYSSKLITLFPTKICFNVSASSDAKYLFGSNQFGAEKLLGKGDLLFLSPELKEPIHLHAPSMVK